MQSSKSLVAQILFSRQSEETLRSFSPLTCEESAKRNFIDVTLYPFTCVLRSESTINFFKMFLGRMYVNPVSLISSEDT